MKISNVGTMDNHMKNEQRRICAKHQADYVTCDDNLKCGVALDTVGKQPVYGIRHPVEKGTTGWYIWAGEYSDADDFYEPLCAEHLPGYFPEAIPYLGLPPGYGFIIDKNGYEDVWFDPKLLEI